MKTKTHKVFLQLSGLTGMEIVTNYEGDDPSYVTLASQEVEFVINKTDDELTQAQIDGLQGEKRKILAAAEARAAQIDAQIQSLLAITHEPA